eukprot:TRINITY_DN10591_c0_g1_i1.p1 TRINITY_DN10591_c0_g1~~TRINITY_DN10591_c0_g1_i1.p1  ORF type:complete len:483 (-),score=79.29 TRINITY_DN10591_c0_g1_i1:165-1613(-)
MAGVANECPDSSGGGGGQHVSTSSGVEVATEVAVGVDGATSTTTGSAGTSVESEECSAASVPPHTDAIACARGGDGAHAGGGGEAISSQAPGGGEVVRGVVCENTPREISILGSSPISELSDADSLVYSQYTASVCRAANDERGAGGRPFSTTSFDASFIAPPSYEERGEGGVRESSPLVRRSGEDSCEGAKTREVQEQSTEEAEGEARERRKDGAGDWAAKGGAGDDRPMTWATPSRAHPREGANGGRIAVSLLLSNPSRDESGARVGQERAGIGSRSPEGTAGAGGEGSDRPSAEECALSRAFLSEESSYSFEQDVAAAAGLKMEEVDYSSESDENERPAGSRMSSYCSPPTYKPSIEVSILESVLVGQKREERVEYIIQIRSVDSDDSYRISRRFNNFVWLHHQLCELDDFSLSLPPKTMFKATKSEKFMARRFERLDQYLKDLILDDRVVATSAWLRFSDASISSEQIVPNRRITFAL